MKKYLPIILLTTFCLVIISIWFKDGKLLATGEEGLILANPQRAIELYKYSWIDVGSGIAAPGANPMSPLFYIEAYALSSGIPTWVFQATIFYLLMLIGSCSIYYLSKELFQNVVKDNLKVRLAFISAVFYILNPISLLGVWYRFLLGFMFFYALAPLFFYLFIVGINNKKGTFIFIAPFLTLGFTFAFASPALPLLLWFLPFIYSLCLSWTRALNGRLTFKKFPLVYFCLSFGFWVLINLWWIFPYIELSKIAFSAETSLVHAVGTLKANSKDFVVSNVIRLIHGGFLYRSEAFGSIYKTPFFLILSWLIPIITIYGLVKLKSSRIKLFFGSSLILLLFLVKGTSPPFGALFLWFFEHITFLQVYRNPLEKIGMLLPIIYAPLFSFGLWYLLFKIHRYKFRIILLLFVVGLLGIKCWPFFTGALASFEKRDIRVEVPSAFESANKAIPTGDHIILSIPVMGGASGFHKWQYGYKGVDSSEYLFDYPVITKFYNANSFWGQLLVGLSSGQMDNNLVGISQIFSADVIAYRKDTDVEAFGYNLDALERSENMINQSNLSKIFDSQEVSLWFLPEEKIVPIIYTPHSVRFGDSPEELIYLIDKKEYDPKKEVYICTNKDKCIPYSSSVDQTQIRADTVPGGIEFTKISPTRYDIKIRNSKGKFLLVFNNSYHPEWVVFIEGEPLSFDKHFAANGYANGFIIDKVGNFDIALKFTLEDSILKAYKISFSAILMGILVLIYLLAIHHKVSDKKMGDINNTTIAR